MTRRSELSAPWGIGYPATRLFSFMTVEKGSCVMQVGEASVIALETGDVLMCTPGQTAWMADDPATPAVPYAQVLDQCFAPDEDRYALDRDTYPTIRYGGGGRTTVLRGWGLRSESYTKHPLLSLLPPFIHINYERRCALPWLDSTLRFISHETQARADGSDMMIMRLADVLFVQIIRAWFQQQADADIGWLGALRDRSIRHALKLIHEYPADAWTVETLARAVGVSRSNFSSRFQALAGTPPLKYLTQLRMHLAANALRQDASVSLTEVANRVGYESESSFGRAFRRHFGVSPGTFRSQPTLP